MAPALKLGRPAKTERRAIAPRQILSLSGGGFRGLFTARVLERMEEEGGAPLRDCFDLIGGTSIGGILAIGLAAGIPARKLREEFEARGRSIFRSRLASLKGFASARYDPRGLAMAIDAILGSQSRTSFAGLPARILVVAIDQKTASPKIFRSDRLAPNAGDSAVLRDVALATSAAPSYFPPHRIGAETYVDGGLIANAPDLVLATEAMRRFAVPLDGLTLCAIGTAGSPRNGTATGSPGKIAWITRHDLVPLTIDAQAMLAAEQIERLIPAGVLRLDARPRRPIKLDDASASAAKTLVDLADETFARVAAANGAELRAFLVRRS